MWRAYYRVADAIADACLAQPDQRHQREPASDVDTGVVDSLKVLDPDGRLEKRT